jgi:4-carboxymuconolactone decarboxylase
MSDQQRIQGAPQRGLLRKVAYGMARKRLGRVPEPFAVTAHHTKMFGGMSAFEMALERSKRVPERYKALGELRAAMVVGCEFCVDIGSMLALRSGLTEDELKDLIRWEESDRFGELRAAMVVGCEFCVDIGSMLALRSGLTEDELKDLIRWEESDRFDELDRLVLAYADAISRTPVDVPDELFDGLSAHFDEQQLVELTGAIAWENWRARFNWAFGLGKEGYSEGAYCVPVVGTPVS